MQIRRKDLCRWYHMSYETLQKALIETGVEGAQEKGKGNRKHFTAHRLKPLFDEYGTPRELAQLVLF